MYPAGTCVRISNRTVIRKTFQCVPVRVRLPYLAPYFSAERCRGVRSAAAINYGASTPPGEQTELKFACSEGCSEA